MRRRWIYLLLPVLLTGSCSSATAPDPWIELLENRSFEEPLNPYVWWGNTNTDSDTLDQVTEPHHAGSYAVRIRRIDFAWSHNANWSQRNNLDEEEVAGGRAVLTAYVRTEELAGAGAAVALRFDAPTGDGGWTTARFATTQGVRTIDSTRDWTRYAVEIDDLDADIRRAAVYLLMLPGSSGTVYFDDISLRLLPGSER